MSLRGWATDRPGWFIWETSMKFRVRSEFLRFGRTCAFGQGASKQIRHLHGSKHPQGPKEYHSQERAAVIFHFLDVGEARPSHAGAMSNRPPPTSNKAVAEYRYFLDLQGDRQHTTHCPGMRNSSGNWICCMEQKLHDMWRECRRSVAIFSAQSLTCAGQGTSRAGDA